ncbi:MAG: tRNA (adenosine(37)-N6)-threonylcarbamoyltransferase complex transferase subunit TsaD, partial [Fibrobacterota bacterium]
PYPVIQGTPTGLCCGLRIPFMAVNHLEAHLFANFFENRYIVYPIAGLIVSGGNTRIVRIDENREFTLLSDTVDDAAGEAFDKCGKLLGLSYPAGPEISELAKEGDKNYFHFPRAMPRSDNFSFSGLKTAVLNHVGSLKPSEIENRRPDICASFQEAVADVIVKKTARIVLREKTPTLFFSGGVAANRRIRTRLEKWCLKNSVRFCVPEPELCTDNGAMVAMAGYIRYKEGKRCSLKEKTYAVDSLILK